MVVRPKMLYEVVRLANQECSNGEYGRMDVWAYYER